MTKAAETTPTPSAFRRRPTRILAVQFDPHRSLPPGVRVAHCYCSDLAQDGRHCPQHVRGSRKVPWEYEVLIAYPSTSIHADDAGVWILYDPACPSTPTKVLTDAKFRALYEADAP